MGRIIETLKKQRISVLRTVVKVLCWSQSSWGSLIDGPGVVSPLPHAWSEKPTKAVSGHQGPGYWG